MKNKFCFLLLTIVSGLLAACSGGSKSSESQTDSLAVEETKTEVAQVDSMVNTLSGTVVDEMMSTITIVTEDTDTVTYVKGENYQSDAAIGDEVIVTLDQENEEQEIVNVKKI